MKKLLLLITLNSTLCALPSHNPARASLFHDETSTFNACDPCFLWHEALSWRIGYYGNFVFNDYLERRRDVHNQGDIQQVAYSTNGGTLTLNVADWFEFFAMLGTSKFLIITPSRTTTFQSELLFSPRFSWSIGMNGTVWRYQNLAFGFSGQYMRTSPKIDSFFDYGSGVQIYFNNIEKSTYYTWTAAFGASYEFQGPASMTFAPHMAACYSGTKMGLRGLQFTHSGVTQQLLNLKDKKAWGFALGLTWLLRPKVGLTPEVRFGDEKAFNLMGELAF